VRLSSIRGSGSRTTFWVVSALLAAGLVQSAAAGAAPAQVLTSPALRDRPALQVRAADEWYGESSSRPAFSASYRRFLEQVAMRQLHRYPALFSPATPASRGTSTRTWINLGPTKANFATNGYTLNVTDSGRVRSIVVDGSTIYVASAGGGVWKSTNSGSTWAPITDDEPSLSDGSLAMDPNNHSTLYLGFGDPFAGTGVGLVKTTNGGATWSAPVFLGNETIIAQVLVDPSNSNIVLAATNDGLYRSTNAGTSFSQVSINTGHAGVAPMVWSIASTGTGSFVLSLEGNPSVTSGTTDGQVWTSTNDGASWTQATGMTKPSGVGRITVASAPSHPQTVYAMAAIPNGVDTSDLADIFKSTDGGQSWTALNVPNKQYTNPNNEDTFVGGLLNGQGSYNQFVAVDPTDPNTVYFGGSLLIAKTTDGGSSFSEVSNWLGQFGLPYVHADCHAATFDANGNFYAGTDGGVFKSTDGGATFTDSLNVGLIDQLVYSVGSSPVVPDGVIGGFQDLGTRLRESSTSVFDQVLGGDGFGSDMNRTNPEDMIGSLYFDNIYKSTDGGANWVDATSGIPEANDQNNAPYYTKIVQWQGTGSTGNQLYTFSNFKVYKSTNYADSWSALPAAVTNSGNIRNIGVAPGNSSDVGVVATGGRIFLSPTGGSSWTQATTPTNDQLSLSYISFDPNDPNTVYVASVAPIAGASHLWKSTNFGTSWTQIDGSDGTPNGFPTGVPVNVVMVDPQNSSTVYAGTQLGLYSSSDGGATWSRFGAGLPLINIDDLYISADDKVIRAASYGRGFWQLAALNDFSMSSAPGTVSVGPGAGAPTTIFTRVLTGTGEQMALSASGLPTGATAGFNPATVTAGGSSTLTLTAGASTAPGNYVVTVTGTSASATHTTQVAFDVLAPLTVGKSGTGSGTVSSSPSGVSCGTACSHAFAYGTQVTLNANPDAGSTFAGWSGACSGTSCQVTMSQGRRVTATFTKQTTVQCVVPKVKGKKLAAAKTAITHAHCAVGKITKAASKTVAKGKVISQKPPPGKHLTAGAKVNLVVSKGRKK
jgi:PASTA domain/Divergent InlB B-repeat domain/Sortilin, neurotensin receptor 3,